MAVELKMPALSPTMEEGTLAKWLVKEGDEVSSGDILAEIETDKATMEFEAVDEGTISKILVPEGSDGVKVGTVIALMGGEGEAAAPPAPAAEAAPDQPRPSDQKTEPEAQSQTTQKQMETGARDLVASTERTEDALKDIDKRIRATVSEAADFAENSPEPAPAELYTDVLVESY